MAFDRGFNLIPSDDEITLDDDLAAALSDQEATADEVTRPYGRGWDFDFATKRFVALGRAPQEVTGYAQLRVWIEKTLRTARFAHPIYSDAYGIEMPQVYGQPFTAGLAAQIEEAYRAALLVHDRIVDVTDFIFDGDLDSEAVFVTFRVVTDDLDTLDFEDIPTGDVL